MAEELIEEVDLEGKTVAIHHKEELKERKFLHKVALVIPGGKRNSCIFSKRAKDKYPFPDMCVCAIGGKVSMGETPLQAAERETKEEASVSLQLELVTSFAYNKEDYKALFYIFTTREETNIKVWKGDQREVQYFQEFSLPQINCSIQENPRLFAPTFLAALDAFVKALSKPS